MPHDRCRMLEIRRSQIGRDPCHFNPFKTASSMMATAGCNTWQPRVSRTVSAAAGGWSFVVGLPVEWTGLTSWSLPWTLPRTTRLNEAQIYRVPCSDASPGTTLAKYKSPATSRRSNFIDRCFKYTQKSNGTTIKT